MSESIPQTRLFLYVIFFSLLPVVYVLYHHSSERVRIEELGLSIKDTLDLARLHMTKQQQNVATWKKFQDGDPFYIDKFLEPLPLLEQEHETLKKIDREASFALDPKVNQRLNALDNNVLMFSEGMIQSYPYFKEIPESLARPVEVDVSDIQKILSIIEGVEIGPYSPGPNPPQLLINEFKIEKKNTLEGSQTYLLNMKFIKREYSK